MCLQAANKLATFKCQEFLLMSVYNLLDIFYYTLTACLAVILRQTIPIFCLEGISIYTYVYDFIICYWQRYSTSILHAGYE